MKFVSDDVSVDLEDIEVQTTEPGEPQERACACEKRVYTMSSAQVALLA